MRRCSNCNTKLKRGSIYCPGCGIPAVLEAKDEITKEDTARCKSRKGLLLATLGVLLGLIIITCIYLFQPFSKNTRAIAKAEQSVVKIFCYDYNGQESATGSGFIAFNDITVVTNYHVMESAYTCKILTYNDITCDVESVLCYSEEYDIAILKLSAPAGLRPLEMGESKNINKGEPVVAIGSPLGIMNTVSQGILSGRIKEDSMEVLQFTAAISSGSSGGALFDDNGRVIGITYASYVSGQNLNLAVPVELLIDVYGLRGKEQDVSTIYLEKYPYMPYLKLYNDVPEVTIDELKLNPGKYAGKTIKITAYLSSSSKSDVGHHYISEADYVSNLYRQDTSTDSYDFETHPYIRIIENECIKEKGLKSGDIVTVIGEFRYKEKGSKLVDWLDSVLYWNYGTISAKIMY